MTNDVWDFIGVFLPLIAIVAVAAVLRGYTGFGFGMFGVPLVSLMMSPAQAVLIIMFLQIVSGAMALIKDWNDIDRQSVAYLMAAGLPFTIVGTMALHIFSPDLVRAAIGMITVIAAIALWTTNAAEAPRRRVSTVLICGMLSGFLQGFTAMGGAPLAIYYLRSFSPAAARASMTLVFSIFSVCPLFYGVASGSLSMSALGYTLLLIPVLLLATTVGANLFQRFPSLHRRTAVITLFCIGATTIIRSL